MRKKLSFVALTAFMLLYGFSVAFAFNSGSTGSLGAFSPTTNTEVELPADGILNYTTVNIPTAITVTFKQNAANTPVYILATGDVTVAGTINVNGANANLIYSGRSGHGGFEGGLGGTPIDGSNPALRGGKGLGPGGGNPGSVSTLPLSEASGAGGGGGFGSNGSTGGGNSTYSPPGTGGGSYGNMRILPLIGGSGGAGGAGSAHTSYKNAGGAGGGGGGAILIASSGTITVTGSITATGGNGGGANPANSYAGGGGGGTGGAIKLMAQTISGNGTISAAGGTGGAGGYGGGAGGSGRIRFEADLVTRTAATTPIHTYGYPGTVFVTNIPTLRITSVGGVNVPATPSGKYGSPDIILPSTTTNPVTINVTAANIPVGTSVSVTASPEYGASTSASGTLSGTSSSSTASVSITLSTSYQCILMAQATFTVQTAMYYDGEKIDKVRVAAAMGGESEAVYITEKGKEIPAEIVLAKALK